MPLPSVEQFIGTNVTEQGFKDAQKQLVEYVGNEVPKKVDTDADFATKANKATTLAGYGIADAYTKAQVDSSIAAVSGGHKAYQTLAAAQAAQATLPVNSVVEVTNDPTASNNGTYQWNGTTLTKSAYDPLTQAKADATAKANAAEANAINYTKDVAFNGFIQDFYKTQTDTPAAGANGVAGTVVYAEPLPNDGVITKAYGRLADSVTAFTVKIFDIVDANYILVASSTVTVVVGAVEHTLDTPLQIKKGQFIGFYTADGAPRYTVKTSKPVRQSSGDRITVPVSGATTAYEYQMYFKIQVKALWEHIEKNNETATKNSASIDSFSTALLTGKTSLGAETLSGGSTKPAIEYTTYVKPVDNNGNLDSVEFNLLAEDSVGFFVLRKLSGNTYTIVHETDYAVFPSGINTAILGKIPVLKGDLLGWKALNKNLKFDSSVSAIAGGYYATTKTNTTTMTLGTAHTVAQPRIKFNLSFIPSLLQVVILTQSQYDALAIKDPNTFYGVV